MKVKAIKDICQLSDQNFFSTVSEGLTSILENSNRIAEDALKLAEDKRMEGHEILRGIAQEEIAKFFILLDAVRCDRTNSRQFSIQLWRSNDHLAKGIYANVYDFNLATFGELKEYIDNNRKEFYLDGFEGAEYIFPNSILFDRERKIYVDYVETDEGYEWWMPERLPKTGLLSRPLPFPALQLAIAFHDSGCTKPDALQVIADKWRPIQMRDDFHILKIKELNKETLEELAKKGLLNKQPKEVYQQIIQKWLFPMCSLDMNIIKVDQEILREIQRNWSPW